MTTSSLTADGLVVRYQQRTALDGLSLTFETGTVTTLVGPNGSGKSNLLKALARLISPTAGGTYLDGRAIATMPTTEVARRLAILPQDPQTPGGLTVGELVEQGRYPHVGPLRMLRRQDHTAMRRALTLTRLTDFTARPLDELSGGERQRAWIALALAQDTPLLLLDEPTTFLDIRHQLEILDLVRDLNRDTDLTIVMAMHDLNLAARYAHRIVALKAGTVVADGTPRQVLTADTIRRVFDVDAVILTHPHTGTPVCLPADPTEAS